MSRAIFLGSFNPPHKGHSTCLKTVIDSGFMEILGIDKIHVIPCWQNPNKKGYEVSFINRYLMCIKMFSDMLAEGKVLIDDIENTEKPQYTFDLISYFKSDKDPMIKKDFWWIITMETLQEIIDGKWFRRPDLLDNNFIILYNEDDCLKDAIQLVKENKMNAVSIKIDNEIHYHSTELREKIKTGQDIIEETNKYVQEYIEDNHLYK